MAVVTDLSAHALPLFESQIATEQANLLLTHPFVAAPLLDVSLSPEPNQLRVVDLRGVECYPQPDNLQVCGAADTACFLLFTKSEERLPEIEFTLRFGEGLEYSTFSDGQDAYIDYSDDAVFPPPLTDIDVISTQNPEAPSFLISGVTRDSGSVYICYGVRAECGADFVNDPPNVMYEWEYVTESGVACEGDYTPPNDFSGDVIVPRVQFTNTNTFPNNVNLGNVGGQACQTVQITESTPNASVAGYILTADDYGFNDGVMVSEIRLNGTPLDNSVFSVDPVTGLMEAFIDRTDAPLAFNDVDEVQVCYTYTACIPNVDYTPNYTVISACDGIICTGPADMATNGRLISNFPGPADVNIAFDQSLPGTSNPDICSDIPYAFDLVFTTTSSVASIGDLFNLRARVRACISPYLSLNRIDLIDSGSNTVVGTLDPVAYSVRTTDSGSDLAGTLDIQLRRNTSLTGANLIDIDGDGSFDDMLAGTEVRLRVVYDVACSPEDASGITAAEIDNPANNMDCDINQVFANASSGCGFIGESAVDNTIVSENYGGGSVSAFQDEVNLNNAGTLVGFQFGEIGNDDGNDNATVLPCNDRPVSTEQINLEYTLQPNPLATCPNNDGVARLLVIIQGDPRLTNDIVFSNFGFESDNDDNPDIDLTNGLDTNVTYPEEGTVVLEITGATGADATGMPLDFFFDVTMDTAYCSPNQFLNVNSTVTVECATGCECGINQTSSSTLFAVNPDDCACDCYLETFVTPRRISRGFTDTTRTTLVDPLQVGDPDNTRFLPGDTIEITSKFHILPAAANSTRFENELGTVDRRLSFEVEFDAPNLFNMGNSDNYPNILDYQLSRLQEIYLVRDNVQTDIGALFSGPTTGLAQTGIIIGYNGATTWNNFPENGEVMHPAFPNGGYDWRNGDDGNNDEADGKRLRVDFRNIANEFQALDVLLDEIGSVMPGDTFVTVWTTVLLDNPGQSQLPEVDLQMSSRVNGDNYIDRAAGLRSNYGLLGCPDVPAMIQYFSPQVTAESRIVYNDECEAEVKLVYRNTQPPAGWYANEFRPINGVEQVVPDIPFPYYYNGGATVDAFGAGPTDIFPDATFSMDSAVVGGVDAFVADGIEGQLQFTDAEFADSVRSNGYDNFDNGNNDITTVGGTFPLIGVGGADGADSLVFTIPLRRLCGTAPIPGGLSATYSWANRHLGDYEDWPYRVNTDGNDSYWLGKVTDNDGNVVTPDVGVNGSGATQSNLLFYFPFQRLQDDPTDEVNPHREIDQVTTYSIIDSPVELVATMSVAPAGDLTDAPGDEVKTITITPDATQTLAGVVLISVGTGGAVTGVSSGGGMLSFTTATITDSSTVYAVPIPATLGPDDAFTFDLSTDLLFCEAAEICITPILGCSDDPDLVAEAANAFNADCGDNRECYSYLGGSSMVRTVIQDPQTIDLCESQTFTVQYFNDGTGDLANFSPIIFIPEGLTVSNFMYSTTGGGTGILTDPTYDVANDEANQVFGEGRNFTQAEIDAAVATNGSTGFNPGQVLTITFDGVTSCDFTSGTPLVSDIQATGVCSDQLDVPPTISSNINIDIPAGPQAIFSFDVDDQPLEISCSDDGDKLTITAANIGKGGTGNSEICVLLPNGISLDIENINALVPIDFVLTEDDITTTDINDGGARQQCFMAPDLEQGAFICLEIPFVISDAPCGPQFIGATVTNMVETGCMEDPLTGDNTDPCTIAVSTVEDLFFELNVVPAITANDAELTASCTTTPGVFDVDFSFDFLAESQPYDGDVNLMLYTDVDANGEFDDMIDTQIGMTQTIAIDVDQDVPTNFMGTFAGVDQSEICPLLLVIESLGCECSESVIPFPEVLPDFIDDLGDDVVLCPGESFTFEGVCADLNYTFDPIEAGTVTIDEAAQSATISLNAGFGVDFPVPLTITGAFGSCGLEKVINVSAPTSLGFGPYEYQVCNNGSQEVDLNIPQAQQGDITVRFLEPNNNIENPNSFEPIITDLQANQVYQIEFSFNDGECIDTTTLTAIVQEAIIVEIDDLTGCSTGFNLSDRVTVTPASATGKFQTDGDGTFSPDNEIPGEVNYTPGPLDIERGFVDLRYNSDTPDGPCGPTTERVIATILLVDCGSFPWGGERR